MTLPAPPVPATLDLRGLPWMPLDVVRLRDSDLAMVDDAEVFRCSVLSWCVSWHQVPAASLPDDDAALARLLGYGRDLRGWRKVRAAGGLRGWQACDDGRLYHPVVATKALEAAQQQERAERKREADRKRLDEYRSKQRGSGDDTRDVAATTGVSSAVNRTRQDRTGQDSITPPPLASASDPPAAAAGLHTKVRGYDPAKVVAACNAGDLLALVGAFGGNLDRGDEWARDAAGQRIGTIAAVFDWRMASAQPIREPSGLRTALAEWGQLAMGWRKTYARDFAKDIGLPLLPPTAPPEPA